MEKKANDKTCLKLYKTIETYPKLCQPIRYPPKTSPESTSFHDLILSNLNSLVPNVDMALHAGYDHIGTELWIQKTKNYIHELHENIRNKCEVQIVKLKAIKQQEINCENLDMQRVANLPDDLIRYIHEFLLPETRIQMLLAKYPLYIHNLNRITCANLKMYLVCVHKKYVKHALCYNSKFPERYTCVESYNGFYGRFTKKENGLRELSKIFDALRNAIPKTPSFHRYFQRKALQFLQSLIYVGVYKIDKVRRNKTGETKVSPLTPSF
jgi:hypothetical protein